MRIDELQKELENEKSKTNELNDKISIIEKHKNEQIALLNEIINKNEHEIQMTNSSYQRKIDSLKLQLEQAKKQARLGIRPANIFDDLCLKIIK